MATQEHGQRNDKKIFKNYLDMPVWQLRHLQVSRFIAKYKIDKILDIGCAQGTLINRLSRSDQLKLLIGIDIDQQVLTTASQNVKPELLQDQLSYIRTQPLHVKLYNTNIFENIPKQAMQVQLITMIQFIEHVEEHQLQELCQIVFGRINVKYVMITTPNSEFNEWFSFKAGQMRHPDHRFQWDRDRFQEFGRKVGERYGYNVEFFGVGQHVSDYRYGDCSQGAKFIRIQNTKKQQDETFNQLSPLLSITYPFWKDSIAPLLKTQLLETILHNNYQSLQKITQQFLQTKIGKKLQSNPQYCSQQILQKISKNKEYNKEYNKQFDKKCDKKCDKNFIIQAINCLDYCFYDMEKDYVYYQYEESIEEKEGDDAEYWRQREKQFWAQNQRKKLEEKDNVGEVRLRRNIRVKSIGLIEHEKTEKIETMVENKQNQQQLEW